jgi:predicted RNase H-like HicB family nuclease
LTQSVWSFNRPGLDDQPPVGYVVLRFKVEKDEDGAYVGECLDLDVSSFGATVDEALTATLEATACHLEALDMLGKREKVFADRGIMMFPSIPGDELEITLKAHPGEVVSAQRLSVLV